MLANPLFRPLDATIAYGASGFDVPKSSMTGRIETTASARERVAGEQPMIDGVSRPIELYGRPRPDAEQTAIPRGPLLLAVALFTAALWGAIIYAGSVVLGTPINLGLLGAILAAIFVVLLLVLSIVIQPEISDRDTCMAHRMDRERAPPASAGAPGYFASEYNPVDGEQIRRRRL